MNKSQATKLDAAIQGRAKKDGVDYLQALRTLAVEDPDQFSNPTPDPLSPEALSKLAVDCIKKTRQRKAVADAQDRADAAWAEAGASAQRALHPVQPTPAPARKPTKFSAVDYCAAMPFECPNPRAGKIIPTAKK